MSLKDNHNLDYAVLLCTDMAATRRFYEEVMGFAVETDTPAWVSFRIGATLLTLRPRDGMPIWQDGPAVTGSASVQLAFRVPPPSVDTCYRELLAHGVPIVREPTDLPSWRHRTLFFRDPENNVIEIYAEY
ncbi:VOC family protein [Thalassobaculum litoreum]|uniref:Glyoxylase I family protein n=1 Tax=Thalassobaculum litoreum DSM 18839 TaxID=1123362 RepID=A0A8G2BE70_9PROT|nr:VOC family protein [Thalassobaculum litoreum]SDF04720.1 glyoxylase I family protein [Thalassobaculum litoreum DSM 18839]